MSWFAVNFHSDYIGGFSATQRVTWKALQSVLRQEADGDEILEQFVRDSEEHFAQSRRTHVSSSGERCGITWRFLRDQITWQETLELRGPLAQLDWDYIATGRGTGGPR